ncbi:MAG: hypothetical protein JSV66_02740 [Trueperaceae bacterium]|nr:MAG: hypothetical protein JSV66_02740 [Trueperaceae bacterium]
MFKAIRMKVEKSYPGVALSSPVQGWAYLDQHERGIATFRHLASPSAADDRWLGVCHRECFAELPAREAFYRAIARGEGAARLDLALLLIAVGRSTEARSELEQVERSRLLPCDEVLLLTIRGMLEEGQGELQAALRNTEEAWRKVQGLPEFAILAPSMLTQLSFLHSCLGEAEKAHWCVERAGQIATGLNSLKVRLRCTDALIASGLFTEARDELVALDLSEAPRGLAIEKSIRLGEVLWSLGHRQETVECFLEAIRSGLDSPAIFAAFRCHLSLATLLGFDGQMKAAREHLARTQSLMTEEAHRLQFRFREALLELWQGERSPQEVLPTLKRVASEFVRMGLQKESGQVRLHVAELLRRLGDERFEFELDAVSDLCSLHGCSFLAREWVLLPELRVATRSTHPHIVGPARSVLHVYSLGQERLELNGEPVELPIWRALETLVYFLEQRSARLESVLADLFPDKTWEEARSYFHHIRLSLNETVPGVEIAYDPRMRLYRLSSDLDILWDVESLRSGHEVENVGLFLPSSANEWVHLLQESLETLRRGSTSTELN